MTEAFLMEEKKLSNISKNSNRLELLALAKKQKNSTVPEFLEKQRTR